MAPMAGAVVKRMAMKSRVQPAEERACATRRTLKKRAMTWGRPAVPIISDRVIRNRFSVAPCRAV